jgi:hypothetical protein
MFTQSAAWYDRFYDCKDYAREAQRVAALIRQHQPRCADPGRTQLARRGLERPVPYDRLAW